MDASPHQSAPAPPPAVRSEVIHLRVSPEEKRDIELAAAAVRSSVSDFLRNVASQGQVMTEIKAAEQRQIGIFQSALKAADQRAEQRALDMYRGIHNLLHKGHWEG